MYLKHIRPYQLKEAVEGEYPLLVPAGCIETHGAPYGDWSRHNHR